MSRTPMPCVTLSLVCMANIYRHAGSLGKWTVARMERSVIRDGQPRITLRSMRATIPQLVIQNLPQYSFRLAGLRGTPGSKSMSTGRHLSVSGALAAMLAAGSALAQEPIKIGVTQPLTGAFAASGNYVAQGAKLAEEDINAAGGVLNRKIQLIVEDNKS